METVSVTKTALDLAARWWFLEIAVGLLVLVGVNFLFKRVVRQLRQKLSSQAARWKEKIDYILYVPFQILMWILGVTLVLEIVGLRFHFSFLGRYIEALRGTGFAVCIVWVLLRGKNVMKKELLCKNAGGKSLDPHLIQFLTKIFSVIVIVFAVVMILQTWGLNIGPLVGPLIAFGGVGAAAIGFSAKDMLANLFGGVMLHMNRSFAPGDFIHLPRQEVEGVVEEIGWNATTIRDRDKRPVYLPNSLFANTLVINSTRMTHRHILEKINVGFEDFSKIAPFTEHVTELLKQHPDVDTTLPFLIVLNSMAGSAMELLLDVYVVKTSYEEFMIAKQQVLSIVYQEALRLEMGAAASSLSISGKLITVVE